MYIYIMYIYIYMYIHCICTKLGLEVALDSAVSCSSATSASHRPSLGGGYIPLMLRWIDA